MEEFSKEEIALTREQRTALFLKAQPLQSLCQKARAQHEHNEENLCYPTQVSQVGRPLC